VLAERLAVIARDDEQAALGEARRRQGLHDAGDVGVSERDLRDIPLVRGPLLELAAVVGRVGLGEVSEDEERLVVSDGAEAVEDGLNDRGTWRVLATRRDDDLLGEAGSDRVFVAQEGEARDLERRDPRVGQRRDEAGGRVVHRVFEA
jgi:hypothetical protein